MTAEEIRTLANQLEAIKNHYYYQSITSKPYVDYALDIEFKLDAVRRQLYIKQFRVYND